MKISVMSVLVDDQPKALRFYTEVLAGHRADASGRRWKQRMRPQIRRSVLPGERLGKEGKRRERSSAGAQ